MLADGGIEVDEGALNGFHLGPVLRKYTNARLNMKTGRRGTTSVELPLLYDALGLLRSLQYDVGQFNAAAVAMGTAGMTPAALRYACYRLTRQASALGVRIPRGGSGTVDVPWLDPLITHIEGAMRSQLDAARGLLAGGIVDFDALAEFYRPGVDVLDRGMATGFFGVATAMRVRAGYYSRGKSLFGVVSTFFVALECVVSIGDRFAVIEAHVPMPEFSGTRSTHEGFENFNVLTDSMRAELARRGETYARMTTANAFVEYVPGAFLPVPRGGGGLGRAAARARGGGRVMIDSHAAWTRGVHCARSEGAASDAVKSVLKLVAQRARTAAAAAQVPGPDGYTAGSAGQTAASEEESSLELLLLTGPLPESLMPLTWPVVAGFAFAIKSWGVALVSGLRDIVFNEAAFSSLVIPPSRKRLIEALVLSHRSSTGDAAAVTPARADIIAGKGEGTIFLLYGPPGVGKTLTAEAIAELLHKPLYVVSMGELGTTPEALEERLQDVLDLCVPWGALVLIDEAEMLLEQRTKSEVLRNAMVCVMLRLLEYYSGILFLTTNRVEALDPAFQSRVQCALRYAPLDNESRKAVWSNLIAHAEANVAPDVDLDALAAAELNGRQIKNALQLALALSRHEGAQLSKRHLDATLDVTSAFVSEFDGLSTGKP